MTKPNEKLEKRIGHYHPLTIMIREAVAVLRESGFIVTQGPEIESEYYNFDALNVPADHPSRDMQDTFWIKGAKNTVLRTQTSSVQVRFMEKHAPPFRVAVPGRVFRNEATDVTHETQFYQIEGFAVGEDITLAQLKGTLTHFFKKIFGASTILRFRPSFFPFVEPGIEVDISCTGCSGKGCGMCKQTGWLEVMGAGMIHPRVLAAGNIDPEKFRGFAFGGGVDRLVMLRHGIDDIRLLYDGDLRLIEQF